MRKEYPVTQTSTTDWDDDLYPPENPDDLLSDEEWVEKQKADDEADRAANPHLYDYENASAEAKAGDEATDPDESTDATPAPAVDQKDLDDLEAYLATGPADHQVDKWMAERGMLAGPDVPATSQGESHADLDAKLDELHARGANDAEIDRAMQEAGVW